MKAVCAVSFLVFLAASSAQAAWRGECVSDFKVKATMDSFTGHATSETFVVAEDATEVRIDVKIEGMKTGKAKRDKEMVHMFQAEEFPVISGTIAASALRDLKPGETGTNELPFKLVMHGQTNDAVASVTGLVDEGGKRTFNAAFPVSLKTFDLKPPSILGIINVNDKVLVTTHVTLTQEAAAQP